MLLLIVQCRRHRSSICQTVSSGELITTDKENLHGYLPEYAIVFGHEFEAIFCILFKMLYRKGTDVLNNIKPIINTELTCSDFTELRWI